MHDAFYDALNRGDENAMNEVWAPAERLRAGGAGGPLDRFISGGARVDGWATVLRPDRRPEVRRRQAELI